MRYEQRRELAKSKHGPNPSVFYNGFDRGWKDGQVDAMNSEAVEGLVKAVEWCIDNTGMGFSVCEPALKVFKKTKVNINDGR